MPRLAHGLIDYAAPSSEPPDGRRFPLQLPLFDLLVLCCACSRLKTDRGKWSKRVVRASDYPETDFSHGICPSCLKKLYPTLGEQPTPRHASSN
jgi:hypothetical protein